MRGRVSFLRSTSSPAPAACRCGSSCPRASARCAPGSSRCSPPIVCLRLGRDARASDDTVASHSSASCLGPDARRRPRAAAVIARRCHQSATGADAAPPARTSACGRLATKLNLAVGRRHRIAAPWLPRLCCRAAAIRTCVACACIRLRRRAVRAQARRRVRSSTWSSIQALTHAPRTCDLLTMGLFASAQSAASALAGGARVDHRCVDRHRRRHRPRAARGGRAASRCRRAPRDKLDAMLRAVMRKRRLQPLDFTDSLGRGAPHG